MSWGFCVTRFVFKAVGCEEGKPKYKKSRMYRKFELLVPGGALGPTATTTKTTKFFKSYVYYVESTDNTLLVLFRYVNTV